jgi:Domain of unknown function (DUF6894)
VGDPQGSEQQVGVRPRAVNEWRGRKETPKENRRDSGYGDRVGCRLPEASEMPKYFFHIEGSKLYRDEIGVTLPDDGAAWDEARRAVRNIEHYLAPGEEWRLEVCAEGKPVFTLTVSSRRLR